MEATIDDRVRELPGKARQLRVKLDRIKKQHPWMDQPPALPQKALIIAVTVADEVYLSPAPSAEEVKEARRIVKAVSRIYYGYKKAGADLGAWQRASLKNTMLVHEYLEKHPDSWLAMQERGY
jgi:hypothetical protein